MSNERRSRYLSAVLVGAMCCAPAVRADSAVAGLSPNLIDAILQQLNRQRASLGVADMPPVAWDADLAAFAARTAAGCRMQHTGTAQRSAIPNKVGQYAGENLAIAFRSDMRLSDSGDPARLQRYFQQAFDGWWREQADYDYAANRCAPGKQCGHYTQLAWRDSVQIGCAIAMCNPQLDLGRLGYTLACNFLPGGNIVGRRPY
ncbi:MAG: CAP domain-containing protein [Chitinivorax sp.]